MGPNYLNKLSKKKCKKEVKERSECKNWSKKLKVYFYVKQIIDKYLKYFNFEPSFEMQWYRAQDLMGHKFQWPQEG